ncbi:1,4-alpha-glucan branching protein [Streptomyces tateyamensis]|uniref:1,4-alpha-glucan branching protein n=1 Tax=Streptomyces tateyamensis TaxID=565073 RepID=A0A2V4P3N1_9ACTN|nr:1,4-alpha-glucan branching protein [Streptomyces tateyamensis]PYC88285.1 1,4-alpha-glucan branching protein [Streptomyces tateyamensis]
MAVIHHTTLTPTKLELLAAWLPQQDWYAGSGAAPVRAGGFRLDDPAGEVGMEFLVVTAGSVAYLVPLTYRGAPLPGPEAEAALIGTTEHGVLGTRWVYDGVRDPVLVEQLRALLAGRAVAQAQDDSDAVDRTVQVGPVGEGGVLHVQRVLGESAPAGATAVVTGVWQASDGTEVRAVFAALTSEDVS